MFSCEENCCEEERMNEARLFLKRKKDTKKAVLTKAGTRSLRLFISVSWCHNSIFGNENPNGCRVVFKRRHLCAIKRRQRSEDRSVEQHDGFGFGIGGVAEVVDVAVGTEATDDGGAGRRVNGLAK